MALPWGKQPSSAAVPGSGELDVSIVHWGERSARNANLFSPGKLPKDGAALCWHAHSTGSAYQPTGGAGQLAP